MLKTLLVALVSLIYLLFSPTGFAADAKQITETPPLILTGKITRCPETVLYCYYKNETDETLSDTLHLERDGSFYLRTKKVTRPSLLNIRNNNIQLNGLLVAPGYHLQISGDGQDYLTLFRTKKITGKGAEANLYLLKNDSMELRSEHVRYLDLDETNLISYTQLRRQWKDSLAQSVFMPASVGSKEMSYFRDMTAYDNLFLSALMALSYARFHQYDAAGKTALLKAVLPGLTPETVCRDEYLKSQEYRTFVATDYLSYLLQADYAQDSLLRKDENYPLRKIVEIYSGKVLPYVLFRFLTNRISHAKDPGILAKLRTTCTSYDSFFSRRQAEQLQQEVDDRALYFRRNAEGHPAAEFTLRDENGRQHSLRDFLGKVVYLDLWASWCGPCRAETPFMKELADHYKTNSNVVIIGIAVSDGINEWKEAIKKDQPTWLQLIDHDQLIYNYYLANLIPRFVVIDKNGNILKSDAPAPSRKKEIMEILDAEINRQSY